MELANPCLFRQQAYINGQWVDSCDHTLVEVRNPADNGLLGTVPNMGQMDTHAAIESAQAAWNLWRSKTAKERASILQQWYNLLLDNQHDLARIITLEQGKPLKESLSEVIYGAGFIEWFAEEAKRVYGDTIPAPKANQRIIVIKQSVGVVAAITPWNFPIAMLTRKCAPALAVGCPVVIKPAESTPFSALALAALAEQAGFPAGVFNIVTGYPETIGAELTNNPLVRKVSFTGSTEVGKLLMQQCATTVKKISLELGGNAPFIVFDDADLELAIAGAISSKYRNSGQTCICVNRFFVQSDIYDVFADRFTQAAQQLKVGNGLQEGVQQGPLINQRAVEKVEAHIQDAVAKGARLLCGGRRHLLGGQFFEPTVLADVTPAMRITQEETFGPVAALMRFNTTEEAIHLANSTPYGLAAYFYSRNVNRIWKMAEALEYGMVGINESFISTEVAPFGGIKQSGFGREGSKYGINDFLEIKYLCMGGLPS